MDQIQHHGVKGMKWGVRRYRSVRRDARLAESNASKTKSKLLKNEQRQLSRDRKLERSKKVSLATNSLKNKYNNKAVRGLDKVARLTVQGRERSSALNKEEGSRLKKDLKKDVRKYNKAVEKAKNLPVEIKERKVASYIKPAVRELTKAYIQSYSGAPVDAIRFEKTANDRFDENVLRSRKTKSKNVMRG